MKAPFIIYVDFECVLIPATETINNRQNTNNIKVIFFAVMVTINKCW